MGKDLLIATLVVVSLAILGLYEGLRLLYIPLPFPDPVGPGGYLLFISVLLLICGIGYFCAYRKRSATADGKRFSFRTIGESGRLLIVLALYSIAVPIIGYIVATGFFFMIGMRICGEKSWLRSIIISLLLTGGFELLFERFGGIQLP